MAGTGTPRIGEREGPGLLDDDCNCLWDAMILWFYVIYRAYEGNY